MDKDYKKLYEEALERARDLHDNHALGMPFIYQTCEDIFPVLKESEDERIRRELYDFITCQYGSIDDRHYHSWISWITKHKQEPIEQDSEVRDLWVYIREWNDKFGRLPKDEDELASCIDYVMKRQKPAEWSKEDEKMYQSIIDDTVQENQLNGEQTNWLKDIKYRYFPQPK